MLEATRIGLFLATLAAIALAVAMHLGRVDLRPSLHVLTYAALPVLLVVLIVSGLRGPRYPTPPKVPIVLKALVVVAFVYAAYCTVTHVRSGGAVALDVAFASETGRRAVTSVLVFVYALAFAFTWRRVPKRQARF